MGLFGYLVLSSKNLSISQAISDSKRLVLLVALVSSALFVKLQDSGCSRSARMESDNSFNEDISGVSEVVIVETCHATLAEDVLENLDMLSFSHVELMKFAKLPDKTFVP